jgi:urease accessory protein
MRRAFPPVLSALPALLLSGLALAHTGVGPANGLGSGFAHPFLGLDHLLAMVAVGVWAAMLGGRAVWLAPLAFVGTLVLGDALAMAGIALPAVELVVAASVVALGAAMALDLRLGNALGMAAVGAFGLFHGHAHGAELPVAVSSMGFGLGFVAATGLLHALGVGLGLVGRMETCRTALRLAGASVATVGLLLLAGV